MVADPGENYSYQWDDGYYIPKGWIRNCSANRKLGIHLFWVLPVVLHYGVAAVPLSLKLECHQEAHRVNRNDPLRAVPMLCSHRQVYRISESDLEASNHVSFLSTIMTFKSAGFKLLQAWILKLDINIEAWSDPAVSDQAVGIRSYYDTLAAYSRTLLSTSVGSDVSSRNHSPR